MLNKLVPVVGNVCESNLGIDEDTSKMMAKEVDIIVNSAANTTFDERLMEILHLELCMSFHIFSSISNKYVMKVRYDIALDINTGGPSRLMNFAKQCHNLKLFLQVSTGKLHC